MSSSAQTTRIATTHIGREPKTPFLLRALNWIADCDRQYREKHTLRSQPNERLIDMGMTRKDANTVFYQQWN